MDTQVHTLAATVRPTGEFRFARNATTVAQGGTPAYPWRDIGNIVDGSFTSDQQTLEHKGSYRGIVRTDKRVVTERTDKFTVKCDELHAENLALVFGADSTGTMTQAAQAVATSLGDLDFTPTAGIAGRWYDIYTAAGARVRKLLTLTIATLTEGTDFFVDYEFGRIRFAADQSADLTPSGTWSAITSLATLTVGQLGSYSGAFSLLTFDEAGGAVMEISGLCDLSLNGTMPLMGGNDWGSFEIEVLIKSGTVNAYKTQAAS